MLKKFLLLSFMSLAFIACSQGPKHAAKEFSENLAKGKVEEAKKYATESTGKLLDFASSFGGLPVDPNYKFEFLKDSIVENTAYVTFSDQNGKSDELTLYKIDGKWLVNIKPEK
ncbi:nuclear transport factor 2 family protein [Myroides sp. LJL116]